MPDRYSYAEQARHYRQAARDVAMQPHHERPWGLRTADLDEAYAANLVEASDRLRAAIAEAKGEVRA